MGASDHDASGGASGRPLFTADGRAVVRLSPADEPALQRLLERCADYYDLVEGRRPPADAAHGELTEGPAERVPHDLFCLGVVAGDGGLSGGLSGGLCGGLCGVLGALRHHRRANQWYLGLMLLDPAERGRGLGAALYRAFEGWCAGQGADSVLLAVVEANRRAARFWETMGFALPRCYPERLIGERRHILIEYEKELGAGRADRPADA